MVAGLIVIAVFCGFAGFAVSSQATSGVALVALACLFAILGRVVQADKHHTATMERMEILRRGVPLP